MCKINERNITIFQLKKRINNIPNCLFCQVHLSISDIVTYTNTMQNRRAVISNHVFSTDFNFSSTVFYFHQLFLQLIFCLCNHDQTHDVYRFVAKE